MRAKQPNVPITRRSALIRSTEKKEFKQEEKVKDTAFDETKIMFCLDEEPEEEITLRVPVQEEPPSPYFGDKPDL